jgi:hypothetical protein
MATINIETIEIGKIIVKEAAPEAPRFASEVYPECEDPSYYQPLPTATEEEVDTTGINTIVFDPEEPEAEDFPKVEFQADVLNSLLSQSLDSLPSLIKKFMHSDAQAQRVQMSPADAEHCYPSLIKRLQKYLKAQEVDARVVEVEWCKLKIDGSASSPVYEKWLTEPRKVSHAVVKVGGLILDPCRMRMGDQYAEALPWNYVENLLHGAWNVTKDVTHLVNMTPYDIAQLRKFVASHPHNNLTGGMDGSDDESIAASERAPSNSTNNCGGNMILTDIALAADAGPEKFYWMKYASTTPTTIKTPAGKVEIQANALFGIREVRGSTTDEILLPDGTRFRLAIKATIALMNKGKEFRGAVPKIKLAGAEKIKKVDPEAAWGKALLKQYGTSVTTMDTTAFRKIYSGLGSDGKKFAQWVAKLSDKWAKYVEQFKPTNQIKKIVIEPVVQKPPIKVVDVKPHPTQTPTGPVIKKVKLSTVDLPTSDDMYDSDFNANDYVRTHSHSKPNSVKDGKKKIKR